MTMALADDAMRSTPARSEAGLLPAALMWSLTILLFILTASNGEPNRISSGYFVVMIAPLVILIRGAGSILKAVESDANRTIFFALLLFAAANLVSMIVQPTEESIYGALERCLLPMLVYLAMVGLTLSPKDQSRLVMAVALGALVMFVRGLAAYLAEFGIPDLQTILWSRYDTVRIAGFERATVGNVTHMGSYVVLILPTLMIALVALTLGRLARSLIALTIVLGLANLILAGSRAGMLVLVLMSAIIAFRYFSRSTLLWIGTAGAAAIALLVALQQGLGDSVLLERFAPVANNHADGSIDERLQSMIVGWQVFVENPLFGVGPAMSHLHNTFSIPHQSILHQLSELGIVGGTAFIWLNVVVIGTFGSAALSGSLSRAAAVRLMWLIGPSAWLIIGLAAGIVFNLSLALLWVGIAHAMLALSAAETAADDSGRPALSLLRIYRSLAKA
jgi:hypothetical protein